MISDRITALQLNQISKLPLASNKWPNFCLFLAWPVFRFFETLLLIVLIPVFSMIHLDSTAIQINWLPFLPGLACHSIHQVKIPGLTAYQAICLGAGQI